MMADPHPHLAGLVTLLEDFVRRSQAVAGPVAVAVEEVVGRTTEQIRRRLGPLRLGPLRSRPRSTQRAKACSSAAARPRRGFSLQPKAPVSLRVTSDPAESDLAEHVLLYLSRELPYQDPNLVGTQLI